MEQVTVSVELTRLAAAGYCFQANLTLESRNRSGRFVARVVDEKDMVEYILRRENFTQSYRVEACTDKTNGNPAKSLLVGDCPGSRITATTARLCLNGIVQAIDLLQRNATPRTYEITLNVDELDAAVVRLDCE